ncbi:Two-component response regulator-like PRR73 [Platanthera guangdongensis]|uniref:Two-component response regulator-like PRR73 n=1 Tax=Platanthera guangdongensis TaxID=2320717 RepID=A0ABR2LXY1_9ASPA
MGSAHQMENLLDGAGGNGEAELNYGTRNEHKEIRDGRAGNGEGLYEEDEFRINEAALDTKDSHVPEAASVAHNPVLEKQQHKFLAPVVQWERFLPLRTIKVLLVENDDSTRQVVSALLRNCYYGVTAVANVLEAWRVLEDRTNHIDLVLTEVVMPSFSGLGLLCKIMSHKTCKTIPVIMMSSNDSMGIVFKCLSKGAVDFLVKPIRKNELKNLWQHVWRRCHNSSGSRSGSESGIQGQKITQSDNDDVSDNNTYSDDEDNVSIGCNARDESDYGSGTQSSWTERAIEVDGPQSMFPSEQIACPQDSTWARVVHHRPETPGNMKMTLNCCIDSKEQEKAAENKEEYMELTSFELSLKRLRSTGEVGMPSSDERLSNLSAFSRYPVSLASVQAPAGCGGSSLVNNSCEAVLLNQVSNGSSENNDMGSTNKKCNRSASAFHPVQPRNSTIQPTAHDKIDEVVASPAIGQPRGLQKHVLVQHHPRHYHHHHIRSLHSETDHDDSSLENLKATAGTYSLNGSNSCSNHGSDGQNGFLGGANMDKGGDGSGGVGGGGVGADQNRFAQREAVLNKFRQKRKVRNFSKKNYYS